jgi:hypothetical protein
VKPSTVARQGARPPRPKDAGRPAATAVAIAIAAATAGGVRPVAAAEDHDTPPPAPVLPVDTGRFFSLQVENDLVAGTDRHYTNGLRVQWLSAEADVPDWAMAVARQAPFFPAGSVKRWGLSLGHSIFTPSDTETTAPQPKDRPYAGWLYGSLGFVSHTGQRLDTLELTLGMVGPSAQGEFVQNDWHKLIGVDEAHGWDHQLHDEPGLLVAYERKWRAWQTYGAHGFAADLTPHAGVTLGNVMTYGAAGATLRLGQDLPDDYGPPRIRPSLPGTTYFIPTAGFGWYLFAGVEGRVVGRNIFLDGNTFRDSPSVDRRIGVYDLQAGLAMTWNRYRLAYTQVRRSKEFDGQVKADRFGSVNLTMRF